MSRSLEAGAVGAMVALLAGCAQPPDRVFVPGSPFSHVIDVRTAQGATAAVKMGEWLTLHARRRTGPWTEVDRTSLGKDGCWVAPHPPADEPEVANNVTWTTDPLKAGEFDDGLREDHVRRVRFAAPGRYVLKATSSTWCSSPVDSNTLVVVVRP
jgi:hypothetical protein